MIPLKQTIIDDNIGNCLATCVAIILELPLEKVPNFTLHKSKCTRTALREWLAQYEAKLIAIEFYSGIPLKPWTEGIFSSAWMDSGEYVILCGKSPRKKQDGSDKYHAVVGKTRGWGFSLEHDPHPDNTFLDGEPYGVYWLVNTTKLKEELC